MSKITIAIDGYSSCGKSTIARAIAEKLSYAYVDTGAMYRCVTLYALRNNIIVNKKINSKDIIKSLKNIHISFEHNPHSKGSDAFLNGENVEKEIRQMEVSENVSKVATIKEVREYMVELQRKMGKNKALVMDGRDIGTTVFPDAELKIFMTADPDVRTQRRLDELTSKGNKVTFDEVKENLHQRDHEDTHRKESPLRQAKDAVVLDNSDLDKEQQLNFVMKLIKDLRLLEVEL